jgi:hypothetical protein
MGGMKTPLVREKLTFRLPPESHRRLNPWPSTTAAASTPTSSNGYGGVWMATAHPGRSELQ